MVISGSTNYWEVPETGSTSILLLTLMILTQSGRPTVAASSLRQTEKDILTYIKWLQVVVPKKKFSSSRTMISDRRPGRPTGGSSPMTRETRSEKQGGIFGSCRSSEIESHFRFSRRTLRRTAHNFLPTADGLPIL